MKTNRKVLLAIQHRLTPEQEKEFKGAEMLTLEQVCGDELAAKIRQTPKLDDSTATSLSAMFVDCILATDVEAVVLPIGSPAFMFAVARNFPPFVDAMFAYSVRESVDVPQDDGSMVKKTVFKHIGWQSI